ncbi:MAG: hypothetical protein ACXVAY_16475 [Mucilaginibacter sp.]
MSKFKHIILLLLMLLSITVDVLAQKTNNLVMANDHLILLLDLNSPKTTLDSLLKTAGISNPDIKTIKTGNYQVLQKQGWNTLLLPGNRLRIDRSAADMVAPGKEFVITSKIPQLNQAPGYPAEVLYGVNNFARITVHELANGLTRFFVPGRHNAKRVMLSGNFNNWSTLQGIMAKTDSGWVRDVRLEPGIYHYKFIFDGNWDIDVNNNLRQDDGAGNINSVYYRYNYSFKLPGYGNAHRVVVAGSFNKWNAGELIMHRVADGWTLNLYLHDGAHLYRFLVDGHPVTDPDNNLTKNDASGAKNSVLNVGPATIFRLGGYENARQVFVAGSFNNWTPGELSMQKTGGVWNLSLTLPAGNYEYRFIVDGHWITDPTNQHLAWLKDEPNSFFAVSPNHTFVLKGHGNAKTVRLSGTFNNWDPKGYTMERKGDDWTISMRLKPGKYLYKFIVDGNWIIDPGNSLWEQNQEHTGNSVLWVD